MDKKAEKIIEEQWEHIPVEIRRVLEDPAWKNKVKNLGENAVLSEDQQKILLMETLLLLLGLSEPGLLYQELQTRLNLTEESASRLAEAIKTTLFGNIEDNIQEAFFKTDIPNELLEDENDSDHENNLYFILAGNKK